VTRRLARQVFVVFVLTFIASRVVVILIMTRRVPYLFLHADGTHVHGWAVGVDCDAGGLGDLTVASSRSGVGSDSVWQILTCAPEAQPQAQEHSSDTGDNGDELTEPESGQDYSERNRQHDPMPHTVKSWLEGFLGLTSSEKGEP
jgi:hypothetical protein